MQFTSLGSSGLRVSRLCLGTMNFCPGAEEREHFAILDAARTAGINFLDTANIYSAWQPGHRGGESETLIGRWLRHQPRHELVIATKARGRMWPGPGGEGLSRRHLLLAAEASLRRLGTDWIDLYQLHWPDEETPLDETLAALDTLVASGKVRYLDCSNFPAWLLVKACYLGDLHRYARMVSLQPHYSLLHRAEYERELAAACIDQGLGVIPYSPLAAGFLSGKYTRENRAPASARGGSRLIQRLSGDEQAYRALDTLRAIARERAVPPAQIALAWLLARPEITAPIVGARRSAQLEEVLGATEITLGAEELARLNEVSAQF